MRDAHIHFEKQPYSLEIVEKMVGVAKARGVTELCLLDHTHKFQEFSFLYEETKEDEATYNHYQKKKYISIKEYLDFTDIVRKKDFGIKILFGLEVCYFVNCKERLKEELTKYDFDFIIGSVHHIDAFAFDFNKESWEGRDIDKIYIRYFEIVEDLIKSKLFTHLAHPDSIKIFGFYPTFDLVPYYRKIAKLLKEYNMSTENNTGFDRYGFTNYGLDSKLYDELKRENVLIYKASDAHDYTYIGNKFDLIKD